MIHVEGAKLGQALSIRTEHELIDDKLAFTVEKIGESFSCRWGFENVVLFDFDPG